MKFETKGYVADVQFGQDRAAVICLTYFISASKQHVGAEFYEVMFTSKEQFTIPSSRPATFQEELRSLHQTVAIVPDRAAEVEFLRSKMLEAYGSAATVNVNPIATSAA